jgi:hypothetical protein
MIPALPIFEAAMFVTDKLVYLQLQKTGCTHIVRMMNELVGGRSVGKKHGRLDRTFPREGRRIVGSIRNPWSWYVSLWAFGCTQNGAIYSNTTGRNLKGHLAGNRLYSVRALAGLWRSLLKPVGEWKRLYADSDDPRLFRAWLKCVFDPARAHDLDPSFGKSGVKDHAGLLTYRYMWLYESDTDILYEPGALRSPAALRTYDRAHNIVDLIIRTEALEEDLVRVLKSAGHDIAQQAETRLRTAQKTNTSRHRPTSDYYDDETTALVAEREALIIEKYGYAPPGGRSSRSQAVASGRHQGTR